MRYLHCIIVTNDNHGVVFSVEKKAKKGDKKRGPGPLFSYSQIREWFDQMNIKD